MWVIYNAGTGWELDSIEEHEEAHAVMQEFQNESFDTISMRWEVR